MNYEIIGRNDIDDVQNCFLENRGITDAHAYLNLDESVVNDYNDLSDIHKAVEVYVDDVIYRPVDHIAILVDCDADGFTSAAMLYKYTRAVNKQSKLTYLLHTGKQHGLSSDIVIPDDVNLLLIPDAGTNDVSQCKALGDKNIGMRIIILDHHLCEKQNPYALIVNNHMSPNYMNSELSGAGVVYQFLRAVDEITWNDYTDTFLDLCAIGNIGDVMDMRTFETRYFVSKGLSQIVNDGLKGIIEKKSFDIGGRMNIRAVEWNITPLINAVCRFGTQEDKETLFKAFIGDDSESYPCKVKNKDTGKFETTEEDVYAHAARLAVNAKARQDKAVKKYLPVVSNWIESHNAHEKNIIFARLPDGAEPELSGLLAIRIATKYHKPALVLRRNEDENGVFFTGSGRNFDNSPLDSLRDTLLETGCFDFVAGHDNAFGFRIQAEKVRDAIAACDELTKNIDFSLVKCDFDLSGEELDLRFIRDVDALQDLQGAGLKEPVIHLHDVELYASQGEIIGKDQTTWRFTTDDDIVFIKFLNKPDDFILTEQQKYINEKNDEDDFGGESDAEYTSQDIFGGEHNIKYIFKDILCKVSINVYNNICTPQVQIIDYEIGVVKDEY